MIWLALTVAGLFGTLVCEYRRALKVRALFKPIASSGFVGLALVAGAFGSLFGKLVLTALVLSFVGDVVLMKRSEGAIRGGIFVFGAAHVAYCAAFLERGVDPLGLGLAAVAVTLLGLLLACTFWGGVSAQMRAAVVVYMGIVSGMLVIALGCVVAGGGWRLGVGAVAFYFSDISVARDRFSGAGFGNRLWGLPLYYFAQIVFALASGSELAFLEG